MMFAGAALALCAAMPAAAELSAELSDDEILFIGQFCIEVIGRGHMFSDYNDSNGYIECLTAGAQLATGNSGIGLDIYPVELWGDSRQSVRRVLLFIAVIICNNRISLGIEEIGIDAAIECVQLKNSFDDYKNNLHK